MQKDNDSSDNSQIETPPPQSRSLAKLKSSKRILIIGAIAVIAIAAGVVFAFANKTEPKTTGNNQGTSNSNSGDNTENATTSSKFMQQYGQSCKNRDVSFSSAPMNMNDLAFIRPLGAVSDGHVTPTDHVYIGPPNSSAADNTYPVLMPADGTIIEVSAMPAQYIGDRAGQKVASED